MTESSRQHLLFDSEHRLRAENLPFDIVSTCPEKVSTDHVMLLCVCVVLQDVWYPLVKQFTFKSEFLPLLKAECKSIQAYYNVFYRHTRPHLTEDEISVLKNLEKEIDALLEEEFSRERGAFVRLCGRSPKDGEPLNKSQVYDDYQKNLSDLLADGHEMTINDKMTAIACTSWLKV